MASDKKRKADAELPILDEPQAASKSTISTPTYVFVVHSLVGDPEIGFQQEVLGIYTRRETANSAAHQYHNKVCGIVSIPERLKPEHESLRDGRYRWMPHEEEVNDDGVLSIIRLRH